MRVIPFIFACFYPFFSYAQCPDMEAVIKTPMLTPPIKKHFEHFTNKFNASFFDPWHMVHDEIVQQGQAITVTAKFDYNARFHKDLEQEYVQAYLIGTNINQWKALGRYQTDDEGKVQVNLGTLPIGEYRIRFVVEGDLTSTDGFVSVVEAGRKAVLFDIDGTLTKSDFEAYADYVGIKTAKPYPYAIEMINAYKNKGYQIIFLTARPYWVAKNAREWATKMGIPAWHYRSNPYGDGPIPPNTQEHKTNYVKYLKNTVGLNIIRAYGNATTDIAAYADGGLPKAETYIIGTNAGKENTQPIYNDYTYHYSTVVVNTPQSSSCPL
ncbi:MAG TPA: HAD family acid phosphatase [Agitococcus sp.]|nr:HAD family acid phosphatase [Agitococcus sp.]